MVTFAPLDKGAVVPSHSPSVYGGMRSFGVYKGGNSENAPFVVFASFCAQKEEYLSYPLES